MTSVDARALAETFGGADPARPLEPDLLPPVPALPAGADPSEADAVLADGADQGPRILTVLHEHLGTQPEWTIEQGRGFTWWPGRLPLTVRIGDPVVLHGLSVVRVTTTTPLLRDVPASPATAERIAAHNARAAVDGLVWDPDARTVALASDIWCHAGDAWLDPLVYSASGLQVAIAESSADELREEIGGEVAAVPHPTSGTRVEHDELVDAGAAFAAAGDRSTPFTEGDLRTLVRSPLGLLPFAVHGPDAMTAEVPARSGDGLMPGMAAQERTRAIIDAARRDRTDPARAHEAAWLAAMGLAGGPAAGSTPSVPSRPGTALLRISFGDRHPQYGAGLAMRLRLPLRARSVSDAAVLASRLNRRELTDVKLAPFVGAWSAEGDAPVFVTHFPVPLARGLGSDDRLAILATFAAWMRERAAWATAAALDGPEGGT
ncbi:MAG: hypothetical protein MUE82_05840 [Chloroflexi bacterium]|jgi:hypothetical protein|nr:hypothetical protein [Chloroflexota bacterium]